MTGESVTRRSFLLGSAGLATTILSGCVTPVRQRVAVEPEPVDTSIYAEMYGPKPDEAYPLPAIPYQKIDPRFYRQMVANPTGERPGVIVVDTATHFLYLTYEGGQAMRYGVGLGRAGFEWAGRGVIQYKREWPRWTPPDEMIARQPELEPYSSRNGGMHPSFRSLLKHEGAKGMAARISRTKYPVSRPEAALADPYDD